MFRFLIEGLKENSLALDLAADILLNVLHEGDLLVS